MSGTYVVCAAVVGWPALAVTTDFVDTAHSAASTVVVAGFPIAASLMAGLLLGRHFRTAH